MKTIRKFRLWPAILLAAGLLAGCGGGGGGGGNIKDPSGNGGSGGGGGDSGGNSNGDTIEVPYIDALPPSAEHAGWLFFSDAEEDDDGNKTIALKAYDPTNGSTQTVEKSLGSELAMEWLPLIMQPKADVSGAEASNIHPVSLFYWKVEEEPTADPYRGPIVDLYKVSTNLNHSPPDTGKIAVGVQYLPPYFANHTRAQFDVEQPDESYLSYEDSSLDLMLFSQSKADGQEFQATDISGHFISIVGDEGHKPYGWLVRDASGYDTNFHVVHFDGATRDPVSVSDNYGLDQGNFTPLGPPLSNGDQLFSHYNAAADDGGRLTFWKLSLSGDDFEIKRLVNKSEKPLKFTQAYESTYKGPGIGNIPELYAYSEEVIYQAVFVLKADPIAGTFKWMLQIYKLSSDDWAMLTEYEVSEELQPPADGPPALLVAGDYLVWSVPNSSKNECLLHGLDLRQSSPSAQCIDSTDGVAYTDIDLLRLGDANGWIYYNRKRQHKESYVHPTEEAIAFHPDQPESRIVISHAKWIGASTSGKGPASTLLSNQTEVPPTLALEGELEFNQEKMKPSTKQHLELGEVFLLDKKWDPKLFALSATKPDDGMMLLGDLSSLENDGLDVDEVKLYGVAPGPHRLVQIKYGGWTTKWSIGYINTAEKDSFVEITEPVSKTKVRPLDGL